MKRRYWIWILWPSFLIAGIAEGLLFTFISPEDIVFFGQPVEASQQAIYTTGFFVLWGLCALSSALTFLVLPKPGQDENNSGGLI
ncbi:MAG TPA: hypothetical protein VJB68_04045 [Methylophilaceae bacterium]|nr:hypothetical protein [Methylophilaceae bacterium]